MLSKLRSRWIGLRAAISAGRIAGQCKTGCRLNDETKSVEPCFLHAAEINRLAKINEENWPQD
jgi:hypothetical protein